MANFNLYQYCLLVMHIYEATRLLFICLFTSTVYLFIKVLILLKKKIIKVFTIQNITRVELETYYMHQLDIAMMHHLFFFF